VSETKGDYEWKVWDHTWNNFKRWFEAMEKKKDKPYVTIKSLRAMIDTCDSITEASDKTFQDIMMKALKKEENGQ